MKTWLRLGTPWEADADSRLSEEHEPAGDDDLQAGPGERRFFMTWGLMCPSSPRSLQLRLKPHRCRS